MPHFNYKQCVFGGMIAIAGADDEITSHEISLAKDIFGHNFDISRTERNEVLTIWEKDKKGFTDLLIEEMKIHTQKDQKEVLKLVYHFIHERTKEYNMSGKAREKGIDKDKLELNLYEERIEYIRTKLGV